MSLKISVDHKNAQPENTARLIGDYLKGAVKAMRRIDSARRFFDKMPNRKVEHKEALKYMQKHPLHVQNVDTAEQLIDGAQKYYKAEARKAPLQTKIDYAVGEMTSVILKDTLLYGATGAVGGVIAATSGASPEVIAKSVVCAVGLVGVARTGSALAKLNSHNKEKAEQRFESLSRYTEAKQSMFVLKMMKKQLTAQKSAKTNAAVLSSLKLKANNR